MRSEHRREGRNVIFLIFHTHFSFSPFIERKKRKINEKETEKILLGICEKRKKNIFRQRKKLLQKILSNLRERGSQFCCEANGIFS